MPVDAPKTEKQFHKKQENIFSRTIWFCSVTDKLPMRMLLIRKAENRTYLWPLWVSCVLRRMCIEIRAHTCCTAGLQTGLLPVCPIGSIEGLDQNWQPTKCWPFQSNPSTTPRSFQIALTQSRRACLSTMPTISSEGGMLTGRKSCLGHRRDVGESRSSK